MITRIEVSNYRCLKSIDQPLAPFQVLVGPNGSGKSTLLDVFDFLASLIQSGLEAAVGERTRNFQDLVWGRSGGSFQLGLEFRLPERNRGAAYGDRDTIRYELTVRLDPAREELVIEHERVSLPESRRMDGTGQVLVTYDPIIGTGPGGRRFFEETVQKTSYAFQISRQQSALAHLPGDETKFPAALWLKSFLEESIQLVSLDRRALRAPAPPHKGLGIGRDGANLPRLVSLLREERPDLFEQWVEHVRTTFPELRAVHTVVRPEDQHRYIVVEYENGVTVPSWMLSDGTLRLLALTILAYIPRFAGTYLIEEPENSLHPQAVETVFQSLSSVYEGQVLIATQSPMFVALAEPQQLLCFSRNSEGATEIVPGDQHPALESWKREVSLGSLFASGILG